MFVMWCVTVLTLITSASAIARLAFPAATRRDTSHFAFGETGRVRSASPTRWRAQLLLARAHLVEVELGAVPFEEFRRRVEVLQRLGYLAPADGHLSQALVAAAQLDGHALTLRPLEAGAIVLLGLLDEVES